LRTWLSAHEEVPRAQGAAMLTLVRLGWGQENPAFRQLFTLQFIPGGTKEQIDWFNELQRISTSPEDAVRNLIATGDTDVNALLAQVSARRCPRALRSRNAARSGYPDRSVCIAAEPQPPDPGR
jgi:hypothetical protein